MRRNGKNVFARPTLSFHNDDACNIIPAFAESCRTNIRIFCENMIIKDKRKCQLPDKYS